MTLEEFKSYIESFPNGHTFENCISEPFSWRGSYDEVAFSISLNQTQTKEQILVEIKKAYDNLFYGYKGGEYRFYDETPVNFEEGVSRYTDNGYAASLIAEIEQKPTYNSIQERLIKIAFPNP